MKKESEESQMKSAISARLLGQSVLLPTEKIHLTHYIHRARSVRRAVPLKREQVTQSSEVFTVL